MINFLLWQKVLCKPGCGAIFDTNSAVSAVGIMQPRLHNVFQTAKSIRAPSAKKKPRRRECMMRQKPQSDLTPTHRNGRFLSRRAEYRTMAIFALVGGQYRHLMFLTVPVIRAKFLLFFLVARHDAAAPKQLGNCPRIVKQKAPYTQTVFSFLTNRAMAV